MWTPLPASALRYAGQRGDQRLALAGAHFGDLAVVQRHAADQLHVEVPHAQRALARLADDGERLGQHVVERRAVGDPLPELGGLRAQRLVGKRGDRRLERVDLADRWPYCLSRRSLRLPKMRVRMLEIMRLP